jgi:hypothetical protein
VAENDENQNIIEEEKCREYIQDIFEWVPLFDDYVLNWINYCGSICSGNWM